MILTLNRKTLTEISTIGELSVNGEFFCWTLEDPVRPYPEKIKGQTAIWEGAYPLIIDYSNRFKRRMPHILDVPMFEGIRIHSGNTAENTEGCILVGDMRSINKIFKSIVAYQRLFDVLERAFAEEQITITIVNPKQKGGDTE